MCALSVYVFWLCCFLVRVFVVRGLCFCSYHVPVSVIYFCPFCVLYCSAVYSFCVSVLFSCVYVRVFCALSVYFFLGLFVFFQFLSLYVFSCRLFVFVFLSLVVLFLLCCLCFVVVFDCVCGFRAVYVRFFPFKNVLCV